MAKPNIAQILREHFKRLGSKGGKVKSQAKSEAARANGKRGGRKPKQVTQVSTNRKGKDDDYK